MRTLAEERFAPITSAIGFLESPTSVVAGAIADWYTGLERPVSMTQVSEPFPTMLHRLEPLAAGDRPRELLVSNATSWTAYFDCGLRGPDAVSTVAYLSRTLRCQGVAIRTTPHVVDRSSGAIVRMGAVQFEMFGPLATDFINYVRTVSCIYDGSRWRFDANGTEQLFEESDRYQARRVQDRFTSDMLERYCRALGIDPFEVDAYGQAAVFIESAVPAPVGAQEMTLAEVQQWLSIVPGAAADLPG